ncbi:MAG TPA: hypothetical protein DCX07_14345 [Phycisphaerales bacterium]|nr:hypothetical protein [Phycisphaerales bacterium]
MAEALREAAASDGRSIYALARDAGIPYPVMYRFLKGDAEGKLWGLTLMTADKLAEALGLELRLKEKG